MNKLARFGSIAALVIMSTFVFPGCSSPTDASHGTTTVTISIPQASKAVAKSGGGTVGDTLPSFTSFHLVISGADMTTMTEDFTSSSSSFSVSSGSARTFALTAQTTNAVYSGTTTTDLSPSTTTTVKITLALADSKMLVPLGTNLARLDDMAVSGSGTVTAAGLVDGTGTALTGLPASFSFSDASYDSEGYVYASSGDSGGGFRYRMLKIRDVKSGGGADAFLSTAAAISSIAVDRKNGFVLYCSSGLNQFAYRTLQLSGTGTLDDSGTWVTLPSLGLAAKGIVALDADESGLVYLLYRTSDGYSVARLSGTSGATPLMAYGLSSSAVLPSGTPVDIAVVGNYVYVLFGSGAQAIERLASTDLSGGASAGSISGTAVSASIPGVFSNPQRFLTGPSGTVFVLDKNGSSPANAVVSFTDTSFTGWAVTTASPLN
jgi:hypothetical protein